MKLKSPSLLLLAALLIACGTTPSETPDAGGNDLADSGSADATDAGDSEGTPDAGGNDTPDAGGSTATKAYVRYAFYSAVEPALRTSLSVKLDGATLGAGVDAAILASGDAYFLPGSTDKWIELEPGAHTVAFTSGGNRRVCSDIPDDCYVEDYDAGTVNKTFTAAAGSYWTIVGAYRLLSIDPEGNSFSADSFVTALEGGPSTTERYVSIFRWPTSQDDFADWSITARHVVANGGQTTATLPPASGVIVKLPGDPTRLTVSIPNGRGGTTNREIDLQSQIGVNDVFPLLWFTTSPQGPMLNTGPGGYFPIIGG